MKHSKKRSKKEPQRSPEVKALHQLAKLVGVQTNYNSAFGYVVDSAPEGIAYVLRAQGIDVKDDLSNVHQVLADTINKNWTAVADPVAVCWEGKPGKILIRFPTNTKKTSCRLKIKLENGKTIEMPVNLGRLRITRKAKIEGIEYVEATIEIKQKLPIGYHRANLQLGSDFYPIFVISAPLKAYKPAPSEAPVKSVGIFAPLYALHSNDSWGIGSFSDLGKLVSWSYSLGCDFVGTLPMLASFSDKPMVEPSPYSPVSRIFWNEIFLDPRMSTEWKECQSARDIASSENFKNEVARLQELREVDYQRVFKLKRLIVEELANFFFNQQKDSSEDFKNFLKVQPQVVDYADFRAVCDKSNLIWQNWPERLRNGEIQATDYDQNDKRYHLYSQFLVHQQLVSVSAVANQPGKRGIYLDFPLSAHAGGYDVWRERKSFAEIATAGCPPDPAHMHGQNWGILPLNPKTIREDGYKYFRACLENHMRYAGFLRLDHVMCFYRLFWVPQNKTAKEGVYIRYQMEEFFALLTLESNRNKCSLIGEDLGTVPPEIRAAMTKHGILRMYCQQRRLQPSIKQPFGEIPKDCICSLNTHDMPPFAAFWKGLEIEDKMKLGYFGQEQMEEKKKDRSKSVQLLAKHLQYKKLLGKTYQLEDVLKGMLLLTAMEECKVMQVNIEDLWLETLPQNIPGTWKERPNWKRKLAHSIESFIDLQGVAELFGKIVKLRSGKKLKK